MVWAGSPKQTLAFAEETDGQHAKADRARKPVRRYLIFKEAPI